MQGKNGENSYASAEKELVAVAASIEEAAKKLSKLRPRARPKLADESLNFEEQILEASKAIIAAVGALVKVATVAQKELFVAGKVPPAKKQSGNASWSEELIEAARLASANTCSLCEAAHAAVEGNPCRDELVASAKAVATSTTQLLVACRTNADPNSKTQKGLQCAGAAVAHAAGALVDAATGSEVFKEEVEINDLSSFTDHLKEELEIQELIILKEKQLEKARAKLFHIRETNKKRAEEEGWN